MQGQLNAALQLLSQPLSLRGLMHRYQVMGLHNDGAKIQEIA